MNGLFQSIKNEACIGCAIGTPPDDAPREHIDDKGHIYKALPCGDICEVTDPKDVWRGCMELAVHTVQWTRQRFVRYRRSWLLAPNDAFNANVFHQTGDRAACNVKAFSAHLVPNFANPIDLQVLLKDTFNLGLQVFVTLGAIRQTLRIGPLGQVVIESGWGNRQNPANRLDPMIIAVIFDELDHFLNGRSSSACAKYAEAYVRQRERRSREVFVPLALHHRYNADLRRS